MSSPGSSKDEWRVEVILPDDEGVELYLTQYKPFRLRALRESPSSFSATHAREAAFADSDWIHRLTNPLATTLVVTSTEDREISSSVTLLGPLPIPKDLEIPKEQCSEKPGVLHWQVAAVYTRPEARRRGLARKILSRAAEWVLDKGVSVSSRCVLTTTVRRTSREALRLYERCGFDTYAEDEGEVRMVKYLK